MVPRPGCLPPSELTFQCADTDLRPLRVCTCIRAPYSQSSFVWIMLFYFDIRRRQTVSRKQLLLRTGELHMCMYAAILDEPSGALRLVSINHRDAPSAWLAGQQAHPSHARYHRFRLSMADIPHANNRGGRPSLTWRRKIAHMHLGVDLWAHQAHPIHSGTRNPGLAFSKAAILASQNQSWPAKPPPSLSGFEHVVSGTVAAGLRRIASKW